MVKRHKVNIRSKVADLQLPKVESVAFLVQYQNYELELTSEHITVVADTDTDTVLFGGDVGNLDDFHDDQ